MNEENLNLTQIGKLELFARKLRTELTKMSSHDIEALGMELEHIVTDNIVCLAKLSMERRNQEHRQRIIDAEPDII